MWIKYTSENGSTRQMQTRSISMTDKSVCIVGNDGTICTCRPKYASMYLGGEMHEVGRYSFVRRTLIGFFGWLQKKLAGG